MPAPNHYVPVLMSYSAPVSEADITRNFKGLKKIIRRSFTAADEDVNTLGHMDTALTRTGPQICIRLKKKKGDTRKI